MGTTPKHTSATCETCNTLFTDLPFEVDECGAMAVLEVVFCSDPECGTPLCQCCSKFVCSACSDTFCASHMTQVEDLKCCPACAVECAAQDSEPALCCPECLGSDLTAEYPEGEEIFRCRSCGHFGDPCELIPEPAVFAAVVRKQPGREKREKTMPEVA